jgi:hypothetical protein
MRPHGLRTAGIFNAVKGDGQPVAGMGCSTQRQQQKGENFMETVGQEVGKIETRLRQLGAKLDRLVAKADEVGPDGEIDYRRRIDHVRDKRALVQSRLDAYKAANGQKWESFKGGVETAWHELADAYKAVKQ